MTRRARLALGAALLVLVIVGEAAIAWRQQAKLAAQRHALEILEQRAARLIAERAQARRALSALPAAGPPHAAPPAAGADDRGANAKWIADVHRLRAAFDAVPARSIPELACLNATQWLEVARLTHDHDGSEGALRMTLAHLRGEAKFAFLQRLQEALVLYCHAHGGELPATAAALEEFFDTLPPAGALDRYRMVRGGKLQEVAAREPILVEQALADELHDARYAIAGSPTGLSVMPGVRISPSAHTVNFNIQQAQRAFASQHGGASATTPEQLAPFLDARGPVRLADVQALWDSPLRKK